MTNTPDRQAIPHSLRLAMIFQFGVGGSIMPFITILLRDRGLDVSRISLVFLASSSTLLVFPFIWGMLADRFIPLNRLFALLNLLAAGALAWLWRESHFLGLLLAFTSFYACYNPTLTLINALSFHHLSRPREQFGRLRAWGSLGWIIPSFPIYLWLLRDPGADLNIVLLLAFALAAGMLMVAFLLPHTPPGGSPSGLPNAAGLAYGPALRKLVRNGDYITLLVAFFLVSGSYSLLIYFSPAYLEDLGVPRAWLGPIQCLGVVWEIILFQWQPRFIQRWGYTASILTGAAALVARQLLFAFSNQPSVLIVSYLLSGTVIVFFHTGISIFANAIAGREVRSTAQTLLVFFGSGMGPMFANWLAGRLAANQSGNLRPVFLLASLLASLALGLLTIRRRHLVRAQV